MERHQSAFSFLKNGGLKWAEKVRHLTPDTLAQAITFLSSKIGLVVVVLGVMHFFNMNAIARFGRKVGQWLREDGAYA